MSEAYPRKIPDLSMARSVSINGRYAGEVSGDIHITGRAGGKRMNIVLPVYETAADARPNIASVWGRTKIADLPDQKTWDRNKTLATRIR